MRINVSVKPNSKEERIEKISESEYKVWLKEKPIDGKANVALIKLLCREFKVSHKNVGIVNPSSRKKVIDINK